MPSAETIFLWGIGLYIIYWLYINILRWWSRRNNKSDTESENLMEAFHSKKYKIEFPVNQAEVVLYRRDTMDSKISDKVTELLTPFLGKGQRIAEYTVIRVAKSAWGTLYSMHLFVYEGNLTFRARVEILQWSDGTVFLNDYVLENS
jgi:hypothetical protein